VVQVTMSHGPVGTIGNTGSAFLRIGVIATSRQTSGMRCPNEQSGKQRAA
jgi:hypothetical protein